MEDCVRERIRRLLAGQQLATLPEAAIKNAVILPVLRCLNWDVEDVNEVYPELPVDGGRVDYGLRVNGTNEVFVEVKRMAEDLRAHEEQLLEYAFRHGVELAILTNGGTWWFYLPKEKGPWDARRFFTLDVFEQDPGDAAKKFAQFLGRDAVESGHAVQEARDLHRSRKRGRAIAETLPRAWDRLVSDPDELLIELLTETVEAMSGFRPEIEQVVGFLEQHRERLLVIAQSVTGRKETAGTSRSRKASRVSPAAPRGKVSQHDLVPEILMVLRERGGRARKKDVDAAIYEKFKLVFEDPWYQESVSHGVPRWQHNIAWAKEIGKQEGYIKPPSESGHGVWELTESGRRAAANYG